MSKRNRNLLIMFVTLAVANALFFLVSGKESAISFDENRFAIADTASIQSIKIGDRVKFEREAGQWKLNETYLVDQSLQRVLFSILQRVRVKKPVDVPVENALVVEVAGAEPMSFSVWGNSTKTKTYFSLVGDDQVYEVQIPGYNDYLGGIFELAPDQWRNRILVDGSWRTIQNLTLDYRNENQQDLQIKFVDQFFEVAGIMPLDSNLVVGYLNQFQKFQVNEWLSNGRLPRYDSLSRMPSMATFTLETINAQLPLTFDIYPKLEGDRFYLGMTGDNQMFVIDERRMSDLLASPQEFSYQPNP